MNIWEEDNKNIQKLNLIFNSNLNIGILIKYTVLWNDKTKISHTILLTYGNIITIIQN